MMEAHPFASSLPPSKLEQPQKGLLFDSLPLFMILAAGLLVGTILQFPRLEYCVNDGSRWNTVFYLVEYGTYEYLPIERPWWSGPKEEDNPWYVAPMMTIDMIGIKQADGGYRYYSSKPPLLPTILAGIVWGVQKVTGTQFYQHPWFIIRTTLIIAQVLPFLLMLWILGRLIQRFTACAFTRTFSIAAIAFATYLTPWSITLNNHVHGAFAVAVALLAFIRIWYDGRREWYWFALAGFFATYAAAMELPAAILTILLLAALWLKDPRRTLTIAIPLAVIPVAAFLVTNYLAIGRLMPAYADFGKLGGFYDYPGSYWNKTRGVDALFEPKYIYLFNMVLGHHGFFLLTPLFLIGLIGLGVHLRRRENSHRLLAFLTLLTTAILVSYYTYKTHNYGGSAQGFRWLFWLIPMWLLFLPTGIDRLLGWQRTFGAALCYGLLFISMISVAYALKGPWGESWAHLLFREFKWIDY